MFRVILENWLNKINFSFFSSSGSFICQFLIWCQSILGFSWCFPLFLIPLQWKTILQVCIISKMVIFLDLFWLRNYWWEIIAIPGLVSGKWQWLPRIRSVLWMVQCRKLVTLLIFITLLGSTAVTWFYLESSTLFLKKSHLVSFMPLQRRRCGMIFMSIFHRAMDHAFISLKMIFHLFHRKTIYHQQWLVNIILYMIGLWDELMHYNPVPFCSCGALRVLLEY